MILPELEDQPLPALRVVDWLPGVVAGYPTLVSVYVCIPYSFSKVKILARTSPFSDFRVQVSLRISVIRFFCCVVIHVDGL